MSHLIFVPALGAPDAGDSIATQTAMTLARLDERLRADRSSLADAVVVTVYMRKGAPPTRTTVVAAPLTAGALVEMSAVAVPAGADRRAIHPSSWMASPNPYSYGIRSGETLFLSGLIARNGKDNSVVSGDVATQTRAVMENAKELLEAAGLSFPHVVSARGHEPERSLPSWCRCGVSCTACRSSTDSCPRPNDWCWTRSKGSAWKSPAPTRRARCCS